MKISINISRILVGILFIFSGLVKANDPLGLSYKMQEFFEIWNDGLAKSSFFLNTILINLFQFLHEYLLPYLPFLPFVHLTMLLLLLRYGHFLLLLQFLSLLQAQIYFLPFVVV